MSRASRKGSRMSTTNGPRVRLGLTIGAGAMLFIPGIWVLADPAVRSNPAAIVVSVGVALSILRWRKEAGGFTAAFNSRFKEKEEKWFIWLFGGYFLISVGAVFLALVHCC